MLPVGTDVAIVGGGFAGVATAWALAARGIRAVVLEREAVLGRYASGRSAGLGRQLAEDDATTALTIRGAALLRTHFPATWTATGGVLSFDDPAHAAAYRARADRFAIAAHRLDRAAVVARWPALDRLAVCDGLAVPSDGVIDIKPLLAQLAAGLDVVCEAAVERVEPTQRGVRVVTSRGTVDARIVVDASGAWAGALTADPPLDAFKRHVYLIEAVPADGAPYLWHVGRDELYLRGAGPLTLVSPCDASVTVAADQAPEPTGEALLRALLAAAAPGWADTRIVQAWACQRSFTADRTMRLGHDPQRPWLVWAAGLGGHGATACLAVGEAVAAAI